MHAVVGGTGRPLVLLHGWPQTWFEWRALLPELAQTRTVIAVDLPGLGDSTGSPATFDKKTLARFVHALVSDELGYDDVDIASHDLGSGVAWAYANEYREQVGRLAVMDFPLPGPGCAEPVIRGLSYHFSLFQEPDVPELLIDDEVRPFLEAFYPHVSPKPEPIPPAEVTEYVRTYSRPQNLTNGFELYRTLAQDEQDNRVYAQTPLTQPILLLAQDGAFEFEAACYAPGATDVTGTAIPGAGHWLNEEDPDAVLAEFRPFFGDGS
ncbi:MAG: alpha/beta hydrolase [Pseudonocardia sp.]|nr:alpha/beta hydrolase [Pseudonocardia sp.]